MREVGPVVGWLHDWSKRLVTDCRGTECVSSVDRSIPCHATVTTRRAEGIAVNRNITSSITYTRGVVNR